MISCFISRRVLIRLLDQCTARAVALSESRDSSFTLARVFCICPFAYTRFHYTRRYEELAGAIGPSCCRCSRRVLMSMRVSHLEG